MILYCTLTDGIITNVIQADENWIPEEGYFPLPEGLWVGDRYMPIVEIPLELKLQAQQDRIEFLEDCIAEMAQVVYS